MKFSNSSFFLPAIVFFVALVGTPQAPAEVWRDFKKPTLNGNLIQLRKTIDDVIRHRDIEAGMLAVDLNTNEILYEHEPDRLLIPASVNKLFTSYSALKRLTPDATFKTTIYVTGVIRDGTLGGDLYIKGGGDPSLVSERMWMLVNELVRSGIRNVTGNLIADSTYFDLEGTPKSRPSYLKDQAYNAPVGALSFNFNTCTIYVSPADLVGAPPTVYTDPENSYIDVVNQAVTGRAGSGNSLSVNRVNHVEGDLGDTVLLRGSIPMGHGEQHFYRNIVNPGLYTAHMFQTFWVRRGLKMDGTVKEGVVPPGARQILEFQSQPLWQIVWGMNKFSNNFVADQLLKKLGAEAWGAPGTLDKGLAAEQEILEDLGIPKGSYQIVDGSGLTRKTHVTARQLVTVLAAASHDFTMGPEFTASLGIAGEDGTLKHRFPGSVVQAMLRAKTGTLDGVNSLAGYTPDGDGDKVAFAILLNDPKVKYGRMTGWIDQVALAIAKFTKK